MDRAATMRLTKQRQIILEELRKVRTHPTADEVYEIVRKRLPRISLGTVYRNLELMSEQGWIKKLEITGVKKRFDGDIKPHYHVRCIGCGTIGDVEMRFEGNMKEGIESASGFDIMGYNLEFLGKCPACKAK